MFPVRFPYQNGTLSLHFVRFPYRRVRFPYSRVRFPYCRVRFPYRLAYFPYNALSLRCAFPNMSRINMEWPRKSPMMLSSFIRVCFTSQILKKVSSEFFLSNENGAFLTSVA